MLLWIPADIGSPWADWENSIGPDKGLDSLKIQHAITVEVAKLIEKIDALFERNKPEPEEKKD